MTKPWKVLSVAALSVSVLAACGNAEETPKEEPKDSTQSEETKVHEDYTKFADEIAAVKETIQGFEDPQNAIDAGYIPEGGFVPMMGYHFANFGITEFTADKPNTLLYVIDENGEPKLVGAEWSAPLLPGEDPSQLPDLGFESSEWAIAHEASAHYADGTEIPVKDPAKSPKTNPETSSEFVSWHPDIYGVHMYFDNPDGPFTDVNTELAQYTATSPALFPSEDLGLTIPDKEQAEDGEPTL